MMESGVGVVNDGNIVWCIFVVVLLSSFSLGFCTFWGVILLLWGVIFVVGYILN